MKTVKLDEAIRDLVAANRVLAYHRVVDAFGHISVRHPENSGRYLLSRSRSPELVTKSDIVEFDLDSNPIDQRGRNLYIERPIHGCIYQARPDVTAVCHNHAHSLIPFSVSKVPVRPIFHFAAGIGREVPVWDISDDFGDATNLLVVNNDQGRSLASRLGSQSACLMRGHGSVVATTNIKATVLVAISLMQNAAMLSEALKMGEIKYLAEGELDALADVLLQPGTLARAWEYWCRHVGISTQIND
jgi:ribulose-5-phosphate 4-epimerase/fuculose-1-phosphate aldolase